MKWTEIVIYLSAVVPTFFILAQIFCNGHFTIDPTFVHVETSPDDARLIQDGYIREVVTIAVLDCPYESVLHSWLYLPENAEPNKALPIVVMSHGLGAQKDMGLTSYGNTFSNAGYAVLIFDYRHFGGSYSKKPVPWRNLIHPWNHYKDIITVVNFIKSGSLGSRVDSDQIVLWGTSMSGGHVITAAHALPPNAIRGIIAQVAHLDGKAATKRAIAQRGTVGTIRVLFLAIADFVSHLLNFPPIYVKIAGGLLDTGYMQMTEQELSTYFGKHPARYLGGWKNLAPARSLAILSLYNPKIYLKDITVPILFVAASRDTLCPVEIIRAAVSQLNRKEVSLLVVDGGHFDVYTGEPYEQATKGMLSFLANTVSLK